MTTENESTEPESTETRTRRSQTKRELDALTKLVELLKPLAPEQRGKIIASANEFLKE